MRDYNEYTCCVGRLGVGVLFFLSFKNCVARPPLFYFFIRDRGAATFLERLLTSYVTYWHLKEIGSAACNWHGSKMSKIRRPM